VRRPPPQKNVRTFFSSVDISRNLVTLPVVHRLLLEALVQPELGRVAFDHGCRPRMEKDIYLFTFFLKLAGFDLTTSRVTRLG
jgi:hypothetical protein